MTHEQRVGAIKELAKNMSSCELEDVCQTIWDLVEETPEFLKELTEAFADKGVARLLVDPKGDI